MVSLITAPPLISCQQLDLPLLDTFLAPRPLGFATNMLYSVQHFGICGHFESLQSIILMLSQGG